MSVNNTPSSKRAPIYRINQKTRFSWICINFWHVKYTGIMLMLISTVDVGETPRQRRIFSECEQPASKAIFNQIWKLAAPLLRVSAVILIKSLLCKHWLSDMPQNIIAVVGVSNVRWLRTAVAKTSWEAIRDNSVVKILWAFRIAFPVTWVSCKSRAAVEPHYKYCHMYVWL
jgi:hypothetical protein